MRKKIQLTNEYSIAIYLLKNRFNTVDDILRYWSICGPCQEPHPSIEDYNSSN